MSFTSKSSVQPPLSGDYGRVGSVISGKYRVERVLGSGGMGIVLACQHLQLRRTVAIKLLLPRTLEDPRLVDRLVREARAAAALKSAHVARVFDVGELDTGAPYIVMEYLEGETLAAALRAKGRLDQRLAIDYALQICEALAEAHGLGIVHRDLKPANLFLARTPGHDSTVRVLDFGIAKALASSLSDSMLKSTDSHAFIGSPAYVSPEQLTAPRNIDARTDIWSLGVVLYECLSGRLPFGGDTLPRLWDAILRDELPPLDEEGAEPGVRAIVQRCLEKDRDRRYSNVLELARELEPFASERARASLQVIEVLLDPNVRPDVMADSSRRLTLDHHSTLDEAASLPPRQGESGRGPRLLRPWLGVALLVALVLTIVVLGQRAAAPEDQIVERKPPARKTVHTAQAEPTAERDPSPQPIAAPRPEPRRIEHDPTPPSPQNPTPVRGSTPSKRAIATTPPRPVDSAPKQIDSVAPPAVQAPAATRPVPTREPDEEAAYSDRE